MLKDRMKAAGRWGNSDLMHYLRFAVIPLAAVLLIAVIMKADRQQAGGEEPRAEGQQMAADEYSGGADAGTLPDADGVPDDGSAPGTDAAAEDTALAGTGGQGEDPSGAGVGDSSTAETREETAAAEAGSRYAKVDISALTLKQDEIPELTALVRTYCQAKEDRDPRLLASLFGISGLSEEEAAAWAERMELVKASVKGYENISCYSIEGPEPGTYVIFPYFEVRYREAETLMPQLTWAYVTTTGEGRLVMTETVDEDVAAYIARIGEREDVRSLKDRVAEAATAAVEADAKLRSVYGSESEVVLGDGGQARDAQ